MCKSWQKHVYKMLCNKSMQYFFDDVKNLINFLIYIFRRDNFFSMKKSELRKWKYIYYFLNLI